MSCRPTSYLDLEASFEVLYALRSGEYILLSCISNRRRQQLVAGQYQNYWEFDRPPEAHRVSTEHAVQWLIARQFEIPSHLQTAFESVAAKRRQSRIPPQPRPLEHWARKEYLWRSMVQDAAEVKVAEVLKKIVDAATDAVQAIREWPHQEQRQRDDRGVNALSRQLFARYPLKPAKWWGAKNLVPPRQLELLELRWPDGMEDARESIRQLREVIQTAATVLYEVLPPGDKDRATAEERDAAELSLIAALPEIEQCAVDLQTELETLTSGTAVEKARPAPGKKRPPCENAFAAYRLKIATGATQEQIAKMLVTLRGITPDQGQVSRWLREVRDWISAGNVLPPIEGQPASKAQSVDPCVIDMGANLDHRTPRQRRRRTDDKLRAYRSGSRLSGRLHACRKLCCRKTMRGLLAVVRAYVPGKKNTLSFRELQKCMAARSLQSRTF